MSEVTPDSDAASGFAPALSSLSTIVVFPLAQARKRGVIFRSLAALTLAPAFSNTSTIEASSRYTAQCKAVAPSPSGALTSTCFCRSARTAETFFCLTASRRELSLAEAMLKLRRRSRRNCEIRRSAGIKPAATSARARLVRLVAAGFTPALPSISKFIPQTSIQIE